MDILDAQDIPWDVLPDNTLAFAACRAMTPGKGGKDSKVQTVHMSFPSRDAAIETLRGKMGKEAAASKPTTRTFDLVRALALDCLARRHYMDRRDEVMRGANS